jgi:hypothetical protein
MTQSEKPVTPTGTELDAAQVEAVAGGDCVANDYLIALAGLKEAYENLISFTSYVIERVAPP